MSLTITSQPSTILQSANNDSYFVVSGTTNAAPNVSEYKFVADVLINGAIGATLKSFPDPTTGFGAFNLRRVVNDSVTYDFPIPVVITGSSDLWQPCPNSSAIVRLLFREEFVSGSTFMNPPASLSGNTDIYINSAISYTTSLLVSLDSFVMSTTPGKFLLSKKNATSYLFSAFIDLNFWLHFYQPTSTVSKVVIKTLDFASDTINTKTITNPNAATAGLFNLGVGIPQISAVDGSFFDGASYYTVQLMNSSNVPVSELITFQIKENCGRFAPTSVKLYWLGHFGEFNSWYFNRKNITTLNKTQSTFKKIQGSLQSNGKFVQQTFDPSIVPFYTAIDDQSALSTDFLSDDDVTFLSTLFGSPAVYMEDQNGTLTNVTVGQNSYVLNKRVNARPYSLSFTIQSSTTNFSQLL